MRAIQPDYIAPTVHDRQIVGLVAEMDAEAPIDALVEESDLCDAAPQSKTDPRRTSVQNVSDPY